MPPMVLLGTVLGGLALVGILLVAVFGPRFARKRERDAPVHEGEARPWDVESPKKGKRKGKKFLSRRSEP